MDCLGCLVYLCDIFEALAEFSGDLRDAAQQLYAFADTALAWCISKQPTATESADQACQTPTAPAPTTVPVAAGEFFEPTVIIEAPPPPPQHIEI